MEDRVVDKQYFGAVLVSANAAVDFPVQDPGVAADIGNALFDAELALALVDIVIRASAGPKIW